MLKKIKGSSSATTKATLVKKSAKKATVKSIKVAKAKKSLPIVKQAKILKKAKLNNLNKPAKVSVAKKSTTLKKSPAAKSVKLAPIFPKALGTIGLTKQWARAKKAWVKAIQTEVKQLSLAVKQEKKMLAIAKADLKQSASTSGSFKGKTLSAAAKAKAKKATTAIKLQNMVILKLEKKAHNAQKSLAQLQQLLLKARAMNKLLSQFDKEWKNSAEVAKPKKVEKIESVAKASKKTVPSSRRAKKMTQVVDLGLSVAKDNKTQNALPVALPEEVA